MFSLVLTILRKKLVLENVTKLKTGLLSKNNELLSKSVSFLSEIFAKYGRIILQPTTMACIKQRWLEPQKFREKEIAVSYP